MLGQVASIACMMLPRALRYGTFFMASLALVIVGVSLRVR